MLAWLRSISTILLTNSSSANCALNYTGNAMPVSFAETSSIAISSNNCIAACGCGGPTAIQPLSDSCAFGGAQPLFKSLSKVAYSPDGTCLAAIDCSTPTNVLIYSVNPDCSLSGPRLWWCKCQARPISHFLQ